MIQIIKPTQKIDVRQLKVLIYGEPGAGKTQLVNTCRNVLLFDTDNGSHRAFYRNADVVKLNDWGEALSIINTPEGQALLNNYEVLAFDTAENVLNSITRYISANETTVFSSKPGSLFNKKTNNLTLQGWGVLKSQFRSFLNSISDNKRDLIFICHEGTERDGENIKKIPQVSGGSYDILIQQMDMIGYIFIENGHRVIDFNPTDRHFGKNAGNIGKTSIPVFDDSNINNFYFGSIINQVKANLGNVNEQAVLMQENLKVLVEEINVLTTEEDCTNFLDNRINETDKGLHKQLKALLNERSKKLGFKYDKDKKQFVKNEVLTTEEAQTLPWANTPN